MFNPRNDIWFSPVFDGFYTLKASTAGRWDRKWSLMEPESPE
jgi:hypothetical protein